VFVSRIPISYRKFDTIFSIIYHDEARKIARGDPGQPQSSPFRGRLQGGGAAEIRAQGRTGIARAFGRVDEPDLLNFQNRGGYLPPYQARQLIRMMDKYGGDDDEVPD
jgi:hypothetical protein